MEDYSFTDPKKDESGVSMRSLRAQLAFEYLNNRKTEEIYENNLDKDNLDPFFNSQFKELHDNVKQELVFLWDEIGILSDQLECLKEQLEYETREPQKKKQRIFGP